MAGTNVKPSPSPKKRTADPGVRVRNGRIYDSENGKTCHQCRQKTRDFAAFCKQFIKDDKPCTMTFCHKCLKNRYGEKAEEVLKLADWSCPKCRGICNCSFCMKKKGYEPTGQLVHTAKAAGLNSALDLLQDEDSGVLDSAKVVKDLNSPMKSSPVSKKVSTPSRKNHDKENQCIEKIDSEPNGGSPAKTETRRQSKRSRSSNTKDSNVPNGGIVEAGPPKARKLKKSETEMKEREAEKGLTSIDHNSGNKAEPAVKLCKKRKNSSNNGDNNAKDDKKIAADGKAKTLEVPKLKKFPVKAISEPCEEEIVLPEGRPLTEVVGVELPCEDVGAAMQFLEFCNAFSEVLHIKKGQPECVLRDLTKARIKRQKTHSALVEFNIKLLSLLDSDIKKRGDAWMQTLKRCIEESQFKLKEVSLDFLDGDTLGYENLDPSTKLKLLNFLCDEILETEVPRTWIDGMSTKFDEDKKEKKEKVNEAKKKEKELKQKAKDDMAKAVLSFKGGAPLSLAEFDKLLSQIRAEADKVHAELLASSELVPKKNRRSDAVRTDPVILGHNGQIFWKLVGYNGSSNILLQDIGKWDTVTLQDKWFIYDEEEEKAVEKYVSKLRKPKPKPLSPTLDDAEEGKKFDLPNSSEAEECLPKACKELLWSIQYLHRVAEKI